VHNGKAEVKNGTYLAEGVGGFGVFEAENMDAAIALAARIRPLALAVQSKYGRPRILVIMSRVAHSSRALAR